MPAANERRTAIRTEVLNKTLRPFFRAVDWVLSHHVDSGGSPAVEARVVAKAALYMVCSDVFGEDAVLVVDSSAFKLGQLIEDTDQFEIKAILGGLMEMGPASNTDEAPGLVLTETGEVETSPPSSTASEPPPPSEGDACGA